VEKAAAALRREALNHPPDTFLGSEPEMLAKLNVSRPTFRQAVKIVAQEQLIVTRRGLRGGLYATRPDTSVVAKAAAVYLKTRDATQEHLLQAYPPTYVAAARMAAASNDAEARRRLNAFHAADVGEDLTVREFFVRDRAFTEILFDLTGNPVLGLYAAIIYDFSMTFLPEGIFRQRPERAHVFIRHRRKLAEAILDGDEELAAVFAQRCQDETVRWFNEDLLGAQQRLRSTARPRGISTAAGRRRSEA
jgi:DNA-binding FadR family transcriptional regulator